MKKSLNSINRGSIVFDKADSEWFQIRNQQILKYVKENWNRKFKGVNLSENNISMFFSDLTLEYHNGSTFKYVLKDDKSSELVQEFFVLISPDHDVFDYYDDFYCFKNGNEIHMNYVHELDNFINSLKCRGPRNSKKMAIYL
jgi:hypothetical protein